MNASIPKGGNSVMSSRIEATDSLDFFPTPPWATRALCEHVLGGQSALANLMVWEPAAGEGHMVEPLKEYFGSGFASDVHDYGKGYAVGSFLGDGFDAAKCPWQPDWIITNPPFRLAKEFAERAIADARVGVAFLLRSVFIESEDRYHFFQKHPLTFIAPFAERVAMTKGVWNPKASTATSYAWFIWTKTGPADRVTRLTIIPPGRKRALTKADDAARFGPSPDGLLPVAHDPDLINAVAALEG